MNKLLFLFITILLCVRRSKLESSDSSDSNKSKESNEKSDSNEGRSARRNLTHSGKLSSSEYLEETNVIDGGNSSKQNAADLVGKESAWWKLSECLHISMPHADLEDCEPGFDLTRLEIRKFKLWKGGIIPYYIDGFSYDKILRDRIRAFLEKVHSLTKLDFVELHQPPDDTKMRWLFFVNRRGALDCVDHTYNDFTMRGVQKVVVGYDCLTNEGQMAALLLAIVGVTPQHNAPNRDDHIKVTIDNILPDKLEYFSKLHDCRWLFHDLNYDFESASHYPYNKYTKNGRATITAINDCNQVFVEHPGGFSKTDIKKINMLYSFLIWKMKMAKRFQACSLLFRPGTNYNSYVEILSKWRECAPIKLTKSKKYDPNRPDTDSDWSHHSGSDHETNDVASSDDNNDDDAENEQKLKLVKKKKKKKKNRRPKVNMFQYSDFDTDVEIMNLKKKREKKQE